MRDVEARVCDRRHFLVGFSGGIVALAGCSEGPDSPGDEDDSPEEGIQDSDGDGVIDAEDYAPQDPEVQSKSDIEDVVTDASESTATVTSQSTKTRTLTPESTPTSEIRDTVNTVQATGIGSSPSMVSEYSGAEVSVHITSEADVGSRRAKMLAIVSGYPDGDVKAYGSGEVVTLPDSGERTYTVRLESGSVPRDERLYYDVFVMPEGETYESVQAPDLDYIAPSDPFRITSANRIERDLPSSLPGETSTSGFERTYVEGGFNLQWTGTTDGRTWSIGFVIHKYAYSEMKSEPRGRDYDEYVAVAQNSGLAEEMAALVNTDLEESGFTQGPYKTAAIIDWIQSFPYVTDDVYEGYDEYPKFPVETLADVGGDCEDTSILLASILQSEPFNYDMILIAPPGHMAAGIYSTELQGRYYTYDGRDYYYIETTGSGWGIGDMPEDYVGTEAAIYPV